MKRKLGTLTIGQAPRSDFAEVFEQHLPGTAIVQSGILDGLSRAQIEAEFAPREGEPALISKLLTGETVVLGRPPVGAALQRKVEMLEAQGCEVILILCTGRFEHLTCKSAWLIEPDRLVPAIVAALAGERRVGIVVPLPGQVEEGAVKWTNLSKQPLHEAASPYGDDDNIAALAQAARDLRKRGADLVLLDCMGFSDRHRRAASEASGVPVILSNSLIARAISELFELNPIRQG